MVMQWETTMVYEFFTRSAFGQGEFFSTPPFQTTWVVFPSG